MATSPDPRLTRLVRSMDDLLEPFRSATKPPSAFLIGAEAEKIGLSSETFTPAGYDGERGVVRVMRELVSRFGWAVQGGDAPLLSSCRARRSPICTRCRLRSRRTAPSCAR